MLKNTRFDHLIGLRLWLWLCWLWIFALVEEVLVLAFAAFGAHEGAGAILLYAVAGWRLWLVLAWGLTERWVAGALGHQDAGTVAVLLLHAALYVFLEILFHQGISAVLALKCHAVVYQLFVLLERANILLKLLLLGLHLENLWWEVAIHLQQFLVLGLQPFDSFLTLGVWQPFFWRDGPLLCHSLQQGLLHLLCWIEMRGQQRHLFGHLLPIFLPFLLFFDIFLGSLVWVLLCLFPFLEFSLMCSL